MSEQTVFTRALEQSKFIDNAIGNSMDARCSDADALRVVHDAMPHIDAALVASGDLLEALQEVVEYHEGRGKYDFSKLNDNDRAHAAYDAWQDVWRKKIHPAIAKAHGQ